MKLAQLGIKEDVITLFKSYLTGRKQRVLANNVYNSFQYITQRVPQGSVLRPLFYILYADDIVRTIKHCEIALYADDTVLYTSNPSFAKLVEKMKRDVTELSNWCDVNCIQTNTDKTKAMLFGSPKRLSNQSLISG